MELYENTGKITKNENRTNSKQPEYRGELNIDGKIVNISLWVVRPTGKYQKPYFNCTLSRAKTQDELEEGAIIKDPEEELVDPLKTIRPE